MSVGVPRVVLGNVVAGDRSSCDASQFGFDRYTVKPVAGLIEHALTMQLASDFDPSLIVRFAPFVSQDQDFELRREEQDLRTKVRSINQVREDRGLDPATWGDDPVGTLAEIPYDPAGLDDLPDDDQDALGDRTMNAPRSGAPSRAAVPVVSRGAFTARAEWERQVRRERKFVPRFTRTMRAIFRDQRDSVLRRLDQSDSERASHVRITADDLFNEEEWREIFEDRVEPLRTAIYTEVVEATLVELDGVVQFDFTETQAAVLRRQGAQLVANVNRTTRAKLARQLEIATVEGESIDQIARRVREVFDVRRNQARTIARTEVLKASQEAQVTAFEVSDVVERKQWNTSLDGSVRDEHAPTEGQIVGLREPFTLGDGEQADAPGIGAFGGVLSAHNSINCRCFVTPVFGKEG